MVVSDPVAAGYLLQPLRQKLILALRDPASAAELARRMTISRQLITFHLRTLHAVGLITHVEDRPVRQMIERVYQAAAERYLIDPVVLGDLAPPNRITDPTSSAQLAGVFQAASVDASEATGPTLALCYDIGFGGREERLETFQTIANSTQKIAKLHDPRGTDEHYRIVIGLLRTDDEPGKNT